MRPLPLAVHLLLVATSFLLAPVAARAQSLIVSGTTTLPVDTVASYSSITVQSGGTLDIGGGSMITVTGAVTIEAGGTVLCRSKNIEAQVDGAWVGQGVTLHAASASIAATGVISADGQGYANGIGPGFPTGLAASTAYRTGASHGGTGTGTSFAPIYGNGTQPTTPGQGAAFFDNETTAGGGAIRLIVDGTLTLDGEISADGTGTAAPAANVFHGGATGGSIWVTADSLTGSGKFTADARKAAYSTSASTTYGESGGGRIAIYARTASGFTGLAASTALAGGGTAEQGTIYFAEGTAGAHSVRVTRRMMLPENSTLNLGALSVENGGVLEVGGGSTLNVSGAVAVNAGGKIQCFARDIAAQVGGAWAAAGVTINAGTIDVAASAQISADGGGYRNGIGPGVPTGLVANVAYRTGASHGGLATGTSALGSYGSAMQPATPGTGAPISDNEQTAGGGALRIVVSGTLTLNGEITADGTGTAAPAANVFHGGASGGSIWVTTHTLTGSGVFTADARKAAYGTTASTIYGESAGGRIAVYYQVASGFSGLTTSTAKAGGGTAQEGTLAFIDTSTPGRTLRVTSRMVLEEGAVAAFDTVSLEDAALLELAGGTALDVAGTLTLSGNSTLLAHSKDFTAQVAGQWVGTGGFIQAANIVIAAGSQISADGEGYRNGVGPGVPASLAANVAFRTGASHGGQGSGPTPAAAYGSAYEPLSLGTGAFPEDSEQTAGGGALRIIVSGTLTLNGEITADGVGTAAPASNVRHGGASGGSIWVTTQNLTGTGAFSANARKAANSTNADTVYGESSGGRIAVYYQSAQGFTGFATSSALRGGGDADDGSKIFVDNSVSGRSMRLTGRMYFDQGDIVSVGALYVDKGEIDLASGTALDVDGMLSLTNGTVVRVLSQNNLAQVDGGWLGTGGFISAGNMILSADSIITADGQGYRNGAGPGFPTGLPASTDQDTGASYGGRGTGTGALPPYGNPLAPVSLGTGAAIGDTETTAGGGALRLIVQDTLALDGEITADGIATSPGFQINHGGATGGSIWVTTGTLTGTGFFTAEGQRGVFINGYKNTGNSSGGRIAVYYHDASGYTGFANSTAGPHDGDADPGTVLFIQDVGGQLSARAIERLDVLAGQTLELHALTLDEGARLDLYGGATLHATGMVDMKDDVLVNFWSRNRDTAFAGSWIGEGARIDAGDMRVAATAKLTADSQGYRDGMGPGGPNTGDGSNGVGGSYGGKGSGATAKPAYGSLEAPRDLGSAGGYNRNAAHPYTTTTAGGAIFLNVARSLEFNGQATAIGSVGDTTHAGATGGSILIRADRLSGSGRLIADAIGGSGNNQSSGGRIAIWAATNSLSAANISARAGGPTAQNGTIHYADTASIAWIRTPLETFTGPTRLEWLTTGSATTVGVDVIAQPATGESITLGTGLAPTADLLWDTTTLADGLYTLTVNKRDSRSGAILGTDTRSVTLLNNAIVLRGTITSNVTLPAGKVSFIVGPIVIPAGVTVTAEPGAIVKVSLGASIVVEAGGSLIALGTQPSPIVFTSILDDTAGGDSNFDGTATAPGVVDWNGLRSNGGTISFNEFAEVRHAVEMVDNDITTTVRWRAGSVRVITRQIDIVQGGALTIEPGAIVKFATNVGLRVIGGTLNCEGTLLRPVIFTSDRDDSVGGDSNGDGSLTTPIAGTWTGVYFEDATATFRHTVFRYGGESAARFRGLLDVRTADVRFESCTFVDILFEGAYLQPGEGGTAVFENCLFARVDRPIFANAGSVATVRNCVFDACRRALHYSGGRIDVTNSAITNSLTTGVILDAGATVTEFQNNLFWNPRATGGNVTGTGIAIGANGVIEGDPKFVDRGALDFRVLAGSAAIDAGSAATDAATDFRGFARLGAAPEIGAYEFTATHSSTVDLRAEISAAPASALSGANVDVTILVRNAGSAAVTGPWRHVLFLRPVGGGADVAVGEFTDLPVGTLAAGASTPITLSATLPEGLVGLYQFGVTVNPREEIFEGTALTNNTSVFATPTVFDVSELPFGGSVSGRFFRSGESRVYKVRPAVPGQTIHLLGDTEPTRGFTQLLVARGRVPTSEDFDVQSPQWDTPDATVSLANSSDDWYYVRIVANELRVPTTKYTLAARAVEFQLTGVGISTVGTGAVTISVLGTDLRNGVTVSLRPTGGSAGIAAREVTVSGGTTADASFDLTGAAAGTYDVVVRQGGVERVLSGGVRVSSAAAAANIITTVAGPGTNRVGFPYFAAITARNTGAADSPTPIITVSGPGMPVDLTDPASPFFGYGLGGRDTGRDYFLAIPPTGNPAVLPAGRSAVEFLAQGITPDGSFDVSTNIVQVGDTTPYDLAGLGATLAPDPKPSGWDDAWTLLATSEPQTLGGLAHLTATAADSLYRQTGFRSNDVTQILSLHVENVRRLLMSNVQGRIHWLDNSVQAPLGGVTISLVRADHTIASSAVTLDDGSFAVANVETGSYDWEISGASPASAYPRLDVGPGSIVSGIDLPVVPGASARVRVLPVVDVAFAEMEVSLIQADTGLRISGAPDVLGNVNLRGLEEGVYTLTASAPDRPPVVRKGITIDSSEANDLGSIQFTSAFGSVTGRVIRTDTLAPLVGATVSIAETSTPVASTDENGNYTMTAIPAGTWTLRARAPGFAPGDFAGVVVDAGRESTADLALTRGATLSGMITARSTPSAGATVELFANTRLVATTLSDAAGRYSLPNIAPGAFTIQALREADGEASAPVTVVASTDQTIDLALTPVPAVNGSVRYPNGKLAGQAGIRVINTPDGTEFSNTNRDGRFSLRGLSAGSYVWSLADGGRRVPFVVAADGTSTTSLDVAVTAGEITGRVVAADGTTPEIAAVHLATGGRIVATTASDGNGEYRFGLVAPGTYALHATGLEHHYSSATGISVVAGQQSSVSPLVAGSSVLDVTVMTGAAPAGFALVSLERVGVPQGATALQMSPLAASGVVRFTALTPGSYQVSAIGAGTGTEQYVVTIAEGTNSATIALVAVGYLEGRITDSLATPLDNVDVVVYRAGDVTRTWRARTDSDGAYTVGALPAGDYLLQIADLGRESGRAGRLLPAPQNITIAVGSSLVRNIILTNSAATVTGAVTAPDGSFPYSGRVSLLNAEGVEVLRRPLDANGGYTLPAPVAGSYTLRFAGLGFIASDEPVTLGDASITANLVATWTGGASQLSFGGSAVLARPGEPLMHALSISSLFSWVGECKESFRKLIEDLLKEPEPMALERFRPPELHDPCLSCPDAEGWYREMVRRQVRVNIRYDAWHGLWEAQIDQVAGEVGLFGVNLLKLAGALAAAQLEAAVLVKQAAEELDAARQLAASLMKPGVDVEVREWAIQRAMDLQIIADRMEALLYTGAATAAAGQLDTSNGKGPKLFETFTNFLNPSTWSSWDSVYGAFADATGVVKAVVDIASLSTKFRAAIGKQKKFGSLLKFLDAFFTVVDPVVQGYKALQTSIRTSLEIKNSEDLYWRAVDAREEAYGNMLAALPLCECAGGEECGCEPPPPGPKPPKPPKPPGGPDGGNGRGRGDRAHDPNAKYTIGYLEQGYVRPDEPLIYTVTFENVATAGLPAQRVLVTDQLSDRLDWSSFELLAAGFNRTSFAIPPSLQRYTTRVNVATDPNPVKCDFRLNPATGLFTIDLRSVDSVTGGFPRDSLAGFLPPNDATHRGEGFVTFMIKPKPGQPDGTQIRNLASIVFDTNEAIVTNETVNTLDATPPQGRVTTLARRSGNTFNISWSGTDLGSGAVAYSVWVSRNNGPWELWLRDTTEMSATFTGTTGSIYRFFATARDGVGWSNTPSFTADTETLVGLGSRLANISTRGRNGTGAEAMIVGFVIAPGSVAGTPKNLLVRGIGPGLDIFHLPGLLENPRLDLFNVGGQLIDGNDNWENAANAAQLPDAFARVGAFGLSAGAGDAALLLSIAPHVYTARVSAPADATGIALVEAYDADASLTDSTAPRLVNLSTRGHVGTGDDLLIAGFVVTGDTPKTLLIRAVGPALGNDPFFLPGVLADPLIRLVDRTGATIFENDDWSVSPDPELIAAVSQHVGAFGLPGSSRDAAMVLSLPPGLYTAQISGKNNSTGIALVELYDAD